jgi:hypothetical protein
MAYYVKPFMLPRWIPASTEEAETSTLGEYWREGLGHDLVFTKLYSESKLLECSGSYYLQPRLAWYVQDPLVDITKVVGYLEDEEVFIRPADSVYDFLTSIDPVWRRGDSTIWIRNLERVSISTNSTTLSLVEDSPIFLYEQGIWWPITPSGSYISLDEEYDINYSDSDRSESWAASGTILINNDTSQVPIEFSLRNYWDNTIFSVDLQRFPGESNVDYAIRQKDTLAWPAEVTIRGVTHGIARRIGRVDLYEWDGLSQGLSGDVSYINIDDVEEVTTFRESLSFTSSGSSYISNIPEEDTLYVESMGRRFVPSIVSSTEINIQEGSKTDALYRLRRYSTTGDPITSVDSESYTGNSNLRTTRSVRANSTGNLVSPDGFYPEWLSSPSLIQSFIYSKWGTTRWLNDGESGYNPARCDEF